MNNTRRIMVVDDDPLVLNLIGKALNRAKYEVVNCSNGVEAIKILENECFDVILSDIYMPELDGVELLKKINTTHKNTPVLIMSGGNFLDEDNNALMSEALSYADEVIGKPFTSQKLLETLEYIIQKKKNFEILNNY